MSRKAKKGATLDLSKKPGRMEVSDKAVLEKLNLRPSPEDLQEIRRLEEASILAEQRLGTLRVA